MIIKILFAALLVSSLTSTFANNAKARENRFSFGQKLNHSRAESQTLPPHTLSNLQRIYGGRVIGVSKTSNGHRVQILNASGKVVIINTDNQGNIIKVNK